MPASLCVFYQYDNEYDELVARHAFGTSIEKALGQRIPLGHNLTGWVGSNRRTIRNSDPTLDFGEEIREFEPSLLSCLSSPVVDDDTLVGVLSLYATVENASSEDHHRTIDMITTLSAQALRNATTYEDPPREPADPKAGSTEETQ